MINDQSFDPGLATPKDRDPGAGQPVPGSPVDRDAQIREESDARLAEISRTEAQRVAADRPTANSSSDKPATKSKSK